MKSYITTTGNIMSETLAIIALRNQDVLVGGCRDICTTNMKLAADFFERWGSRDAQACCRLSCHGA